MPNIAEVLKVEISRLSRKELRLETEGLEKTQRALRREISALKKQMQSMELAFARLMKVKSSAVVSAPIDGSERPLRFSAKGFASRRKALGLSAAEMGLLSGASGQSVYAWETGKSRPRAKHLPAIAALRTMGKKQVAAALEYVRSQQDQAALTSGPLIDE